MRKISSLLAFPLHFSLPFPRRRADLLCFLIERRAGTRFITLFFGSCRRLQACR
jgi:hypothetical protein